MNVSSYDHERLWMKARLFINRALDDEKEFEERAFWAAQSLELLGKSALARLSPLLIANPEDDGTSLLIASGVIEDAGQFSSIPAKAIWSRCRRAFKLFSETEAKKIAKQRNEYVHGPSAGFEAIPPDAWWPRFWAQAVILVEHLDKEISDLVGHRSTPEVELQLARNAQNLKRRLEVLIERAKLRLAQHAAGGLSARLQRDWDSFSYSYFLYDESRECPACGATGRISGEEIEDVAVEYFTTDRDGFYDVEPAVTLTVSAQAFACPVCHLVIDDFSLLQEADLEESFFAEGDAADIRDEPEYMNE